VYALLIYFAMLFIFHKNSDDELIPHSEDDEAPDAAAKGETFSNKNHRFGCMRKPEKEAMYDPHIIPSTK
jgi:hypothetical protein